MSAKIRYDDLREQIIAGIRAPQNANGDPVVGIQQRGAEITADLCVFVTQEIEKSEQTGIGPDDMAQALAAMIAMVLHNSARLAKYPEDVVEEFIFCLRNNLNIADAIREGRKPEGVAGTSYAKVKREDA